MILIYTVPAEELPTVYAVSTRLTGPASAWWDGIAMADKPPTVALFVDALRERFLPTNWALSSALRVLEIAPASSLPDITRVCTSFQFALGQLPPGIAQSEDARLLLVASFVSKMPSAAQERLRAAPPEDVNAGITLVMASRTRKNMHHGPV